MKSNNTQICFHLAENSSERQSFLFFATHPCLDSEKEKTRHLYLGQALEKYKKEDNPQMIQELLEPLQKAAGASDFIQLLYQEKKIFQILQWNVEDSFKLLQDLPVLEQIGIALRIPQWWIDHKPLQAKVTIKLGEHPPVIFDFNSFLDFSISLCLDGKELDANEMQELLMAKAKFILFKGRWVELDVKKIKEQLARWKHRLANLDGVSFIDAVHLLLGFVIKKHTHEHNEFSDRAAMHFVAGEWLQQGLKELREPGLTAAQRRMLHSYFKGTLRGYQETGVGWIFELSKRQLGGILADDMGLGKTVQLISFLVLKKQETYEVGAEHFKTLLVVPVTLIDNWKREITRFAPQLRYLVLHHSERYNSEKPKVFNGNSHTDIVITTYTSLHKFTELTYATWDAIIADEAQFIKNPCVQQARMIKGMKAKFRLALTGTPIENNLSDLWSIFDFILPGFLGSHKQFSSFLSKKEENTKEKKNNRHANLKMLIQPFILRRLKTDKKIIQDLPDKTEMKVFCELSEQQILLYQKIVSVFSQEIERANGIERKGIILVYLMRLKQICNHPAQFLKIADYHESLSGKFRQLRELCESFVSKQEKILIFTQFKEIMPALNALLQNIFAQPGLVLHGEVSIVERAKITASFQSADGPPYLLISLKTGGTGLNLTQATQIVHFDRWWNPAVENQATDRAYRIGQTQKVFVHKFISSGTLEEKIDLLLESKTALAQDLLDHSETEVIMQLSNTELMNIVSLR